MEFFNVVNEKDEIIGRASRKECHSSPKLLHRCVFVIITNNAGELLLSKRSMKKDTNPGKWELMAEHNKPGESYQDAAARGLKEELGISAKTRMLSKKIISDSNETEIDAIFSCVIDDAQKISFDKNEISEVRFMPVAKIKEELKMHPEAFTDWFLEVFQEYLKHK